MKPELANLFTVNTTGQQGDFVLSFFYEWYDTEDGKTTEVKRQKVSSTVLAISDFIQLVDTLSNIKTQLEGIKEMELQARQEVKIND